MAKLKIVTWGNPGLKQKAKEVTEVTDEIRQLVKDMFATMEAENGVGLAGNQVGVLKRIFIVEIPQKIGPPVSHVFINPVISQRSKARESQEEGCLSFPGIYGPVDRALSIEVTGRDLEWNQISIKASDLLARAIQHETDHLDGIVFIERMSMINRTMRSKSLRALVKKTKAEPVGYAAT